MTTIDQVVQANDSLVSAIEAYAASCKPLKNKGISAALEEAQGDVKEGAKQSLWERFRAFIKRLVDWAMGLFSKNKDQLKDKAKKAADDSKTYEELVGGLEQKWGSHRKDVVTIIGGAIREHIGQKAIAMINDDPACIMMMRCGGPMGLINEIKRYSKNVVDMFAVFTAGLANIVENKQYRQGISYIGLFGQIKDAKKPLTLQELPSMIRYDRTAAREALIKCNDNFPELDAAEQAIGNFQKKADELLQRGSGDFHPDDIAQLQKDLAEYVPDAIRGLKLAREVLFSGFMSGIEVNKSLYGGSTVRNIKTEDLVEVYDRFSKATGKAPSHEDINGLVTYAAVLLGPEFEIIKG